MKQNNYFRPLLAICLFSVVLSGCKTFEEGLPQELTIYSFPPGATVIVNGEEQGMTPVSLELARKKTHSLRLERDGYKATEGDIVPSSNGKGDGLVRFGLMEDTGMYVDLSPMPYEVQMIPAELPNSRTADAYGDMAQIILKYDEAREAGQIGPIEHKYKVNKTIEFFAN